MTKLSPLANEIRREYYRQYRAKQNQASVKSPTSERDLRYWEKKASDLITKLEQSGHIEQAEMIKNCPSVAEFSGIIRILTDSEMTKT
jgi:hypothetical protein